MMKSRERLYRLWTSAKEKLSGTPLYVYAFPSFWHYKFHGPRRHNASNYLTAKPNCGAGIGHQMANWNAGLWFSKSFDLRYAHSPFSKKEWETFLGFGEGFVHVDDLVRDGYRKVWLPGFDENSEEEVSRTGRIIDSYGKERVVFVLEQDQGYHDQCGVADDIRHLFLAASARKTDADIYDHRNYNVAVHIRRGDIVIGQRTLDPGLTKRWLSNDYYLNVISSAIELLIQTDKPVHIYIFSQGAERDFEEFSRFGDVHYCLDMDPRQTFLSFVNADLLITSKSSFSYKPALIGRNLKICPADFWHSYPQTSSWILADDEGNLLNLH